MTLGVYLIHDNGLIRNEVVAHLFEDELKNGVYKWALVKINYSSASCICDLQFDGFDPK